ncbi:MAG: deaminase [Candidatus Binataceae bacterium]
MKNEGYWSALEEPWRVAIGLAWEAYVGGNVGIGAVLTDPRGRVVTVGRNRVADEEAPAGRMRSTSIAHAELDVLAQLPPGNYRDYALWTTLEPCVLCSVAIVISNIGSVTFAARDRLWDEISRLTELNEFVASRWPARSGPLNGPVSGFCELLPLLWFAEHKPNGSVIQRYQSHHPQLLALAKDLLNDGQSADLKFYALNAALDRLWTALEAIGNSDENPLA